MFLQLHKVLLPSLQEQTQFMLLELCQVILAVAQPCHKTLAFHDLVPTHKCEIYYTNPRMYMVFSIHLSAVHIQLVTISCAHVTMRIFVSPNLYILQTPPVSLLITYTHTLPPLPHLQQPASVMQKPQSFSPGQRLLVAPPSPSAAPTPPS